MRPQNARVRILLGQLLLRAGRLEKRFLDETEAICRRGVELQPNSVSAQNNLGDVFYLQEKFDQAADCFRKAIELVPDAAQLHLKLGLALQGQGMTEESRSAWRKASELAPHDVSSLNQLAWVLATDPVPEHRNPSRESIWQKRPWSWRRKMETSGIHWASHISGLAIGDPLRSHSKRRSSSATEAMHLIGCSWQWSTGS